MQLKALDLLRVDKFSAELEFVGPMQLLGLNRLRESWLTWLPWSEERHEGDRSQGEVLS